jgi:hypothetical protein
VETSARRGSHFRLRRTGSVDVVASVVDEQRRRAERDRRDVILVARRFALSSSLILVVPAAATFRLDRLPDVDRLRDLRVANYRHNRCSFMLQLLFGSLMMMVVVMNMLRLYISSLLQKNFAVDVNVRWMTGSRRNQNNVFIFHSQSPFIF